MALAPSSLEPPCDPQTLIAVRGGLGAVRGVRMAGVHAGIKARKRDLALLAFDAPQVCAAVVTTNDVKAAPVVLSARHLALAPSVRALVCNSGCANACTGERGMRDAAETAAAAAALIGGRPEEVIVASTGVIGVALPMVRVRSGLERAAAQLERGSKAAHDAAEAILTTDRVPKLSAYAFYDRGRKYAVGGIGKGSGMIAPDMATMLAFLATDFPVARATLQTMLRDAADASFNMISVDGDMSTNDAVYAFAPRGGDRVPPAFAHALARVCGDLARAMVADGEGVTKTLEVRVTAARDAKQARALARAVVNSNLVKTALFGEDPNWGRILAAAGAARAGMDGANWSLAINGLPWVESGTELLTETRARRALEEAHVGLELRLGLGDAEATAWGCDLSHDYVRINASYRT